MGYVGAAAPNPAKGFHPLTLHRFASVYRLSLRIAAAMLQEKGIQPFSPPAGVPAPQRKCKGKGRQPPSRPQADVPGDA